MPAVDVVPTTNKLTTDAVLLDKLTLSQLVKNFHEFFATQNLLLRKKTPLFFPYPQTDQSRALPHPVIRPYPQPDQSYPRSHPAILPYPQPDQPFPLCFLLRRYM